MARRAAVVVASDGVAAGRRQDRAGAAVAEALREAGFEVGDPAVLPDERARLALAIAGLADGGVELVVTTGGTGLGPRDVTPEATRDVIDRDVPGLAEAMRAVGRRTTPMADLSRGLVGARGTTLVVNLPGSHKGAVESLDAVIDLLPHALDLLAGQTQQHPEGHGEGAAPEPAEHPAEASVDGEDASGASAAHDAGSGHGHDADHGHGHGHGHDEGDPCALAHAEGVPEERRPGTLVAVYASPLSSLLLSWGRDLGYRRLVLVEPHGGGASHASRHADAVVGSVTEAGLDDDTDLVVTDHERDGLVDLVEEALRTDARWIGLMGSPRHTAPHVAPLRERGWDEDQIARVHRPIGIPIGSKTPPEIALSTLAGLVADRQGADLATV